VGIGVTYAYTSSSTGSTGSGTIASGGKINVTGSGPWTFTLTASNISGTASANTTAANIIMSIGTVSTLQTGDITNTVVSTNGRTYQYYILKSGTTYTINYTSSTACTAYALIVGGGGNGGSQVGGAGGGGGVAMPSFSIPATSTSQSVTISVAATTQSQYYASDGVTGVNGYSSSVTFNGTGGNAVSPASITALGGGGGGSSGNNPQGKTGGSGGGAANGQIGVLKSGGVANTNGGTNYANAGGNNSRTGNAEFGSGGGGGAGTAGGNPTTTVAGTGGNGIQILSTLYGVVDIPGYAAYYWGGGGGGFSGSSSVNGGNGGLGGGGGGAANGSTVSGVGGGSALNTGGTGSNSTNGVYLNGNTNYVGGNGGANTGGGGGGTAASGSLTFGGIGGSGIVVIAFPIN